VAQEGLPASASRSGGSLTNDKPDKGKRAFTTEFQGRIVVARRFRGSQQPAFGLSGQNGGNTEETDRVPARGPAEP
jgi:hypothetical protein